RTVEFARHLGKRQADLRQPDQPWIFRPHQPLSTSGLRSTAFAPHAPGTKKSCHTSLHSSTIRRPYSQRSRSDGPVLFVPKENLQPSAFPILINAALGSLYRLLISIATPPRFAAATTFFMRSSVHNLS